MFLNLDKIKTINKTYDFCIIGSGPAGMTTAINLAKSGKEVLLLEAGDYNYTEQSQNVYTGQVIGDKYYKLEQMRARYLGGTSNYWAGYCRPLDARDFKSKSKFPETAWPIQKSDLDPFTEEACKILEIKSIENDQTISDANGINKIDFKFSPPVRFGLKYKKIIEKSKNLTTSLNANLTEIITDGKNVEKIVVKDYDNLQVEISATTFILATGGIENSRILLYNNKKTNGKLCGENTPIGNYWMEHPHATIGEVILNTTQNKKEYFSLTESKQNQLNILNSGLRLNHDFKYTGTKKTIANLACHAPTLSKWLFDKLDLNLICGKSIMSAWEQEPVYNNRIELSKTNKDLFDIPSTNLYWKKSENDIETIYKTSLQFGKYLIEKNLGRLRLFDWVLGEDDYPDQSSFGGGHHMGGTRMGTNINSSVVDSNCKVHKQDNLYIIGSSVFPSGGHANPTFTIVQLALRLSKHLLNKHTS